MLKSIIKFTLVFILTAALAIGAASAAFFITRSVMEKNGTAPTRENSQSINSVSVNADSAQTLKKSSLPDHYTVRLEGEMLGVYASHSGKEEFLYDIEVYPSNLSQSDVVLLSGGVRLKTLSELTGFMEDYTS